MLKHLFPLLALCCVVTIFPAREYFNLMAKKYCQHWGDTIESELYRFEPNQSVPMAVQRNMAGRFKSD